MNGRGDLTMRRDLGLSGELGGERRYPTLVGGQVVGSVGGGGWWDWCGGWWVDYWDAQQGEGQPSRLGAMPPVTISPQPPLARALVMCWWVGVRSAEFTRLV